MNKQERIKCGLMRKIIVSTFKIKIDEKILKINVQYLI